MSFVSVVQADVFRGYPMIVRGVFTVGLAIAYFGVVRKLTIYFDVKEQRNEGRSSKSR